MVHQVYSNGSRHRLDDGAARGLGIASIGIGLAEILAPRLVQKMLGLDNRQSHRGVLRVMGIREIMQGFDILVHQDPAPGMRARVVGDLLDMAGLGVAMKKTRNPRSFAMTAAAVLAIGAMDVVVRKRLKEDSADR